MHSKDDLTQADLKALLHYDPDTGVFSNRSGRAVGSPNGHRYTRIYVAGKMRYAHRLAWLYMTGCWPREAIDHIDGDGHNNSWSNLRAASQAQNQQNRRSAASHSRSGLLGVSWSKAAKKWQAAIRVNGRQTHLGLFDDPAFASAAYVAAKRELHPFGTI